DRTELAALAELVEEPVPGLAKLRRQRGDRRGQADEVLLEGSEPAIDEARWRRCGGRRLRGGGGLDLSRTLLVEPVLYRRIGQQLQQRLDLRRRVRGGSRGLRQRAVAGQEDEDDRQASQQR